MTYIFSRVAGCNIDLVTVKVRERLSEEANSVEV
jgi:hypothetical protein